VDLKNYTYNRKPSELAAVRGVTARTIRYWCKAGRLPAIKTPGGHWLLADVVCHPVDRAQRPDENAHRHHVVTSFDPDADNAPISFA
jgi:excisionase family DNA binding protein